MKETVTAALWLKNGDHPEDGPPDREGKVVRYFRHSGRPGTATCPVCHHTIREHGWIDSGAVGHTVCPGNWIVLAAPGQYVPVPAPAFFAMVKEEPCP